MPLAEINFVGGFIDLFLFLALGQLVVFGLLSFAEPVQNSFSFRLFQQIDPRQFYLLLDLPDGRLLVFHSLFDGGQVILSMDDLYCLSFTMGGHGVNVFRPPPRSLQNDQLFKLVRQLSAGVAQVGLGLATLRFPDLSNLLQPEAEHLHL